MKNWWGDNTYDYLKKDLLFAKKEKCFKKMVKRRTSHNKKVKESKQKGTE
jgi:hypothetical protein